MLNSSFTTVTDSSKILQIHFLTYGLNGSIRLLLTLFNHHLKKKKINPLSTFSTFPGVSVVWWYPGAKGRDSDTAESPAWMAIRSREVQGTTWCATIAGTIMSAKRYLISTWLISEEKYLYWHNLSHNTTAFTSLVLLV